MFRIKVNDLLEKKDWNLSELWRRTGGKKGVRYNTLIAYRDGYIKRMNVKDLIKMCDAFGCALVELIEYIPDKK